jgi:ketosteroid isomerase-like protein
MSGAGEMKDGEALAAGRASGGGVGRGPAEVARAFGRALLARDAEAASSYLAAEVRMLSADGTELVGRAAARELLGQITDSGQELEIGIGRCVVGAGVAIATQYWRRSGRGRETGFESASVARLVLARGEAGWEIAIASPWE